MREHFFLRLGRRMQDILPCIKEDMVVIQICSGMSQPNQGRGGKDKRSQARPGGRRDLWTRSI